MPQNPLQYAVGKTPSNVATPLNTDATGTLFTAKSATGAGALPALDTAGALRGTMIPALSAVAVAAAAVVKATPGRVGNVNVIVGGSTAGGVYDCLTTASATTTNQIAALPPFTTAQASCLPVNMVALTGIVVIPGTGQTVSVSYE